METKKEIWINQTLDSTEGMKSIDVSARLNQRLQAIPKDLKELTSYIPTKAIWLAAASIMLLITVNIVSLQNSKRAAKTADDTIYNSYFSYLDEI